MLPRQYVGVNKMKPTKENRSLKYIKVAKSDEFAAQDLRNVTRVEPDILEYVRKQMHRVTVTCEVIGAAILFEEEMYREMSLIEEQLMREGAEQEEAIGVGW